MESSGAPHSWERLNLCRSMIGADLTVTFLGSILTVIVGSYLVLRQQLVGHVGESHLHLLPATSFSFSGMR